jgi:hypothetical protein
VRNLAQYPVTRQEILLFLGAERSEHDPRITGLVGDISPLLLDHIVEIVKASFGMCDGFQRRMNEKGMGFVVPFPEATALIKACSLGATQGDGE